MMLKKLVENYYKHSLEDANDVMTSERESQTQICKV